MSGVSPAPEARDEDRLGALLAECDRLRHAVGVLQRLAFALKELVPRAFEEGFNRRVPAAIEPWLLDWLQSDSKRALEPLLRGGPPPEPALQGVDDAASGGGHGFADKAPS